VPAEGGGLNVCFQKISDDLQAGMKNSHSRWGCNNVTRPQESTAGVHGSVPIFAPPLNQMVEVPKSHGSGETLLLKPIERWLD
jgi:hypothetical protein